MPPDGQHATVYIAWPGARARDVSGDQALDRLAGARAPEVDLAHVAHVEEPRPPTGSPDVPQ